MVSDTELIVERNDRAYYFRTLNRFRNRIRKDTSVTGFERIKILTLTTQIESILRYGVQDAKDTEFSLEDREGDKNIE